MIGRLWRQFWAARNRRRVEARAEIDRMWEIEYKRREMEMDPDIRRASELLGLIPKSDKTIH